MAGPSSLSDPDRARLDGIVQQMTADGKDDAYIQAVVDDFKQKYAAPPGGLLPSSEPSAPAPPLTEFMRNAKRSGAAQFTNLANAALHPVDTVGNILNVAAGGVEKVKRSTYGGPAGEHEKYADAAGQYFKDRFGGVENIKKTAYEDPFGLLADVAGVASLGGGAVEQGAARSAQLAEAVNATKAASTLRNVSEGAGTVAQVGDMLNPARAITYPAKKILQEAALVPIAYANFPMKSLRDEYGMRNILKTIRDRGLVGEGRAESQIQKAMGRVTQGEAQAEAAGAPTLKVGDIESDVRTVVEPEIQRRLQSTGAPSTQQTLDDAIARWKAEHPTGEISLTGAHPLKTSAQELAYESGRDNLAVSKMTQEEFARSYKNRMEQSASTKGVDLGSLNQDVKNIVGAKRTIEGGSPFQLHKFLTASPVAARGMANLSDPVSVAMTAAELAALTVPAVGRTAGIGLNIAAKGIDPYLARLALMRQLSGQNDDTQQHPPNQ
jgi:hypothetical protein